MKTYLNRAVPPPGTIPSSIAALVAQSASFTRSFFSFISTSEEPPIFNTATPEMNKACKRQCHLTQKQYFPFAISMFFQHIELTTCQTSHSFLHLLFFIVTACVIDGILNSKKAKYIIALTHYAYGVAYPYIDINGFI